MERTDSGGRQPVRGWSPGPALAAFHDGVTVICEISAQFTRRRWVAPSPCPEWRVVDLAGHLRCVADDLPRVPRRRPGQPARPADGHGRARRTPWPASWPGRTRRNSPRCPMRPGRSTSRRSPARPGRTRGACCRSGTCRTTSTGTCWSRWAGWPARPARSGICTPGISPARRARTTGPPTRTSCSAGGWRGCRTCRRPAQACRGRSRRGGGGWARRPGRGRPRPAPRGPVARPAPCVRQDPWPGLLPARCRSPAAGCGDRPGR